MTFLNSEHKEVRENKSILKERCIQSAGTKLKKTRGSHIHSTMNNKPVEQKSLNRSHGTCIKQISTNPVTRKDNHIHSPRNFNTTRNFHQASPLWHHQFNNNNRWIPPGPDIPPHQFPGPHFPPPPFPWRPYPLRPFPPHPPVW